MIKKSLTYKNLDGDAVTEDFYFSLSMGDILEKAADDAQVAELMALAKGTDKAKIMRTFTDLIAQSVGKRGGMGLVKSPEFSSEFMNSDAFSVLIWEILNDAKSAAEFVNGLFPADVVKKLAESGALEQSETSGRVPVIGGEPIFMRGGEKKLEEYSRKELLEMSQAEFDRLVGRNPLKMSQDHLTIAYMRKTAGE